MSTRFNPDTSNQIREIHNRALEVKGTLYYEKNDKGEIIVYRGTHEGRLKEETKLVDAEVNIDVNTDDITDHETRIVDLEDEVIRLETAKADKCFVVGISIAL